MTPEQAFHKCRKNNKRNEQLEKIIIKSPAYAFYYSLHVIKGRWIEGENIISTSSEYAYYYAQNVIEGKLPENMHNIMILHGLNNDEYAKYYFNFIK